MSDTTTVVPAPSPLLLNIASALRLGLGGLAGYLVATGKLSADDARTYVAGLVAASTVAWIVFKNTNAAKTLEAWMTAQPVVVTKGTGQPASV